MHTPSCHCSGPQFGLATLRVLFKIDCTELLRRSRQIWARYRFSDENLTSRNMFEKWTEKVISALQISSKLKCPKNSTIVLVAEWLRAGPDATLHMSFTLISGGELFRAPGSQADNGCMIVESIMHLIVPVKIKSVPEPKVRTNWALKADVPLTELRTWNRSCSGTAG